MSKKAKSQKFPDRIYVTIGRDRDNRWFNAYKNIDDVDENRAAVGVYELVATNIVKITKTLE